MTPPFALLCSFFLFAQKANAEYIKDDKLQIKFEQLIIELNRPAPFINIDKKHQTVRLSETDLLATPDKLADLLNHALITQNSAALSFLIPIYEKTPHPDEILLLDAKASHAKITGELSKTIDYYRKIIAINPSLAPIRLDLAIALTEDHQYMAAEDQFRKLQAEKLPEPERNIVDQYIASLQKSSHWEINGGLSFIQDKNINNKSDTKEIYWHDLKVTLPKKESGHGVNYALAAQKNWMLKDHYFFMTDLFTYGKFFWDNHDYDNNVSRVGAGLSYKSNQIAINVLPYVEKEWFGGRPYRHSLGLNISSEKWLLPNTRWHNTLEFSQNTHKDRPWLNGHSTLLASQLLYFTSAKQYYLLGAGYTREATQDPSEYHTRYKLSLGWTREWQNGLSTRSLIHLGQRKNKHPDILNIKRKDHEYTTVLSLWHRAIHFYDITPRLTWRREKTTSNHFYYPYNKNTLSLELNKTF